MNRQTTPATETGSPMERNASRHRERRRPVPAQPERPQEERQAAPDPEANPHVPRSYNARVWHVAELLKDSGAWHEAWRHENVFAVYRKIEEALSPYLGETGFLYLASMAVRRFWLREADEDAGIHYADQFADVFPRMWAEVNGNGSYYDAWIAQKSAEFEQELQEGSK